MTSSATQTCARSSAFTWGKTAPDLFQRFLEAARTANTVIELNTGGLRKDCHEIYPGLPMLKLAAQTDVPITFGSDAHAPGEVALNFREAIDLAGQAGYTRYCRFTRRTKKGIPAP